MLQPDLPRRCLSVSKVGDIYLASTCLPVVLSRGVTDVFILCGGDEEETDILTLAGGRWQAEISFLWLNGRLGNFSRSEMSVGFSVIVVDGVLWRTLEISPQFTR